MKYYENGVTTNEGLTNKEVKQLEKLHILLSDFNLIDHLIEDPENIITDKNVHTIAPLVAGNFKKYIKRAQWGDELGKWYVILKTPIANDKQWIIW